jgi:hypothetical protein
VEGWTDNMDWRDAEAEDQSERVGLLPSLAAAGRAHDRKPMAYDSYGNVLPRPRPMTERQKSDFEKRFLGIGKIGIA